MKIHFFFKRQELLPIFNNTVLTLSKNVWGKSPYLACYSSYPNLQVPRRVHTHRRKVIDILDVKQKLRE